MKSPRKFTRRHLIIGVITLMATAGVALAAVCTRCNGSGNGPFVCFHCKGSGVQNGFACSVCKGRGFAKCSSCNGTGQK